VAGFDVVVGAAMHAMLSAINDCGSDPRVKTPRLGYDSYGDESVVQRMIDAHDDIGQVLVVTLINGLSVDLDRGLSVDESLSALPRKDGLVKQVQCEAAMVVSLMVDRVFFHFSYLIDQHIPGDVVLNEQQWWKGDMAFQCGFAIKRDQGMPTWDIVRTWFGPAQEPPRVDFLGSDDDVEDSPPQQASSRKFLESDDDSVVDSDMPDVVEQGTRKEVIVDMCKKIFGGMAPVDFDQLTSFITYNSKLDNDY
jgi:hypothetical protein